MTYKTELVFPICIDDWAAEVRFAGGLELLIAVNDGKPVLVRYGDEGAPTFTKVEELLEAISDVTELIADQKSRDEIAET